MTDQPVLPPGLTLEHEADGERVYRYDGWFIQALITGEGGYNAWIADPDDIGDQGTDICTDHVFADLPAALCHAVGEIDAWAAARTEESI